MRTQVNLAAMALFGWLASSGQLTTPLAQDKVANPVAAPATGGTPSVLPRPDFHFSGNVGRTILNSDAP
jgi:hypothetical protein